MAGRKEGSRKGKAAGGDGRKADAGVWGMDANAEEDIFFRRVLFSVLVTVVVLVGAWFLVTTVRSPEAAPPTLIVNGKLPAATPVYTIDLLGGKFPASYRSQMMEIAGRESVKRLAGRYQPRCVELADGQMIFCIGEFASEDASGLRELLVKLREFTENGERPFQYASVYRYEK